MSADLHLPLRNQLAAPRPTDGFADENAKYNCGEACISAIIEHFTGKVIPPDDIKDAVLGQGATNVPSQMDAYRAFLRPFGITLTDQPMRVATVTAELDAGHPSVLLIPSAWGVEPPNPANEHSFHFVASDAYVTGASLTCMNPWGGFWHGGSLTYWAERLRGGAVWSFTYQGAAMSFDATKYTKQPDGSYRHANGYTIGSGFYARVKALGIAAPPLYPHEIARPGSAKGETYMPFGDGNGEAITLYYDGSSVLDNEWLGHGMVSLEAARANTAAQLADMRAQRDAVSAKLADLQKAYETATRQSAAKDGQIAQLTQQVADLSAKLAGAVDQQAEDAKAALEGLRAYFAKYPAGAA